MRYYYLTTSLPPLEFIDKPYIGFEVLVDILRINLSKEDQKQLEQVLLYFDVLNIKPHLRKLDLDPHGSLDENELEEALSQKTNFPEKVLECLKTEESDGDKAHEFLKVLSAFFKDQIEKSHGFVKKFFTFEWKYRLLTAGYRAKKHQRDLNQELRIEDPLDPFVVEILKQRDSTYFDAPEGFEGLIEIMLSEAENPLEQHKHLEEFRFDATKSMIEGEDFTVDYLLAYLVMLIIVENINLLDQAKGIEILNKEIKVTV